MYSVDRCVCVIDFSFQEILSVSAYYKPKVLSIRMKTLNSLMRAVCVVQATISTCIQDYP